MQRPQPPVGAAPAAITAASHAPRPPPRAQTAQDRACRRSYKNPTTPGTHCRRGGSREQGGPATAVADAPQPPLSRFVPQGHDPGQQAAAHDKMSIETTK